MFRCSVVALDEETKVRKCFKSPKVRKVRSHSNIHSPHHQLKTEHFDDFFPSKSKLRVWSPSCRWRWSSGSSSGRELAAWKPRRDWRSSFEDFHLFKDPGRIFTTKNRSINWSRCCLICRFNSSYLALLWQLTRCQRVARKMADEQIHRIKKSPNKNAPHLRGLFSPSSPNLHKAKCPT